MMIPTQKFQPTINRNFHRLLPNKCEGNRTKLQGPKKTR